MALSDGRREGTTTMANCEVCGNEYDKAFTIETADAKTHVFDSFECAIHALAPSCAHCGCTVLGHGVESNGMVYCCAHCAKASGVGEIKDRSDSPAGEEGRRTGASRSQQGPGRREVRRGSAGAGARRQTVGISKQSPGAESEDQASLPPRGKARG
jgi:hypothetical protein